MSDTSGGIIIPKDKFQEFVEFSKEIDRRKIKEIENSSKGGIYEVSFVYLSKMVVYANQSSDIPKLSAIAGREKWKGLKIEPSHLHSYTSPLHISSHALDQGKKETIDRAVWS